MDRAGCFKKKLFLSEGQTGSLSGLFTMWLPLAETDKRIDKFCGGVYKIDKAAEVG